jgi:hypothetical protein
MFFNLNKKNFFYFGKNIDNKKNLLKFKDISYIYLWDRSSDIKQVIQVRNFCKVNKIKFYISNNVNLAKLVKADGIHLPSDYKRKVYNLHKKKNIPIAQQMKRSNYDLNNFCPINLKKYCL